MCVRHRKPPLGNFVGIMLISLTAERRARRVRPNEKRAQKIRKMSPKILRNPRKACGKPGWAASCVRGALAGRKTTGSNGFAVPGYCGHATAKLAAGAHAKRWEFAP
jgi:hypothetical protein